MPLALDTGRPLSSVKQLQEQVPSGPNSGLAGGGGGENHLSDPASPARISGRQPAGRLRGLGL